MLPETPPVRVRFAPSPTGALHIGGVRTALYNVLLARKTGGTFIIRIEDTDQTRFVPGAEEYIYEALDWCGLSPDEGVREGGPYGPYRQSERKDIYAAHAQQLIDNGQAYYAFDTAEDLEQMRERLTKEGVPNPQYNSITRNYMRNSLVLPENEVNQLLDSGTPYVIRLKVPRKEEVRFEDLIRGWVVFQSANLDDKVLMKSDGMPTYHLANVVDDHLMKISHVIRGEEWLPSAPMHYLLYKAFGWLDTMPRFAHLPLILKPDGNGKLSKRDGDALGFAVFPLAYTDPDSGNIWAGFREAGYLPEAMINFLALMGWNPGTTQEIFSFEELIEAFTIERIGKSGVKFDIAKARWFNQQYLHKRPAQELVPFLEPDLIRHSISATQAELTRAIEIVKEKVNFPTDFWPEAQMLFVSPREWDEQLMAQKWTSDLDTVLEAMAQSLEAETLPELAGSGSEAGTAALHEWTQALIGGLGIKPGKVMAGIRLAVTGKGQGPDLHALMDFCGPAELLRRVRAAQKHAALYQAR
jgi:glutamyl-tRNA synthetase